MVKHVIILLLMVLPGLAFVTHHARSQEQPAVEEEQDKQVTADKNKPEKPAEEEDLKPEVFIPTDELSEDKDIAFPTNI